MVQAYSRLKRLLGERKLTIPELHRRINQQSMNVNIKSLYRLSNEDRPLERLDLRVAGIICQVCQIALSDLISFEMVTPKLQRLPAAKQKRLGVLMAKNNEGELGAKEGEELRTLVREAEEVTLNNARVLARQRRHLTAG